MIESMAIEQMKLVAGFFILHTSHFVSFLFRAGYFLLSPAYRPPNPSQLR